MGKLENAIRLIREAARGDGAEATAAKKALAALEQQAGLGSQALAARHAADDHALNVRMGLAPADLRPTGRFRDGTIKRFDV